MAVEEFSTADTAQVLETNEAEVKALVDQAASEIAEQVATNVLIIEDEPMIALDLADLVTGLGHDVCETARTHKEAVAAFQQAQAGPRSGRHPARRRQLRSRGRQRDPAVVRRAR